MGTIAGIGRSRHRESQEAGREAARQASVALAGETPHLVLLFATAGHDPAALLAGVREVVPAAPISGCTGEGVICGTESDEGDRLVAVMVVRSDTFAFHTFLVRDYAADSTAAGAALARQVLAQVRDDGVGLLLFPDGLLGNCSELLETLDHELGAAMPILGGAAADSLVFKRTHQFHDGIAVSDGVAAVLVRGRGRLELEVSHGCTPIGLERRITGAEGGWLHTIDGEPAWSQFRQYLDGEPEFLDTEGTVHLSIGEELPPEAASGYEPYIIHTPLGHDHETGALFFPGGGMRAGTAIRMTRRDPDRIRDSARACAERIGARSGRQPALVLQFDCAGRGRQLFGSRVSDYIVHPLQEVLGPGTPWIGFHTYGEIAPIGGHTRYHNYTVALCALYDEA